MEYHDKVIVPLQNFVDPDTSRNKVKKTNQEIQLRTFDFETIIAVQSYVRTLKRMVRK